MSTGRRYCCFGTCNSDQRVGRPGYDVNNKFFRFPQPCLLLRDNVLIWSNTEEANHIKTCEKCKICRRWMIRCKRSDARFQRVRQISPSLYICSKHFDEIPDVMDYSKYLPTSNSSSVSNPSSRRLRMESRMESTELTIIHGNDDASCDSSSTHDEASVEEPQPPSFNSMEEDLILPFHEDVVFTPTSSSYQSTEGRIVSKSVGTQTTSSFIDTEGLYAEIECLKRQIKDLRQKLTDTEKAKANAQLPLVIFEQQLEKNEDMCKFYTGFDIKTLTGVKSFAAVDKVNYWGSTVVNDVESLPSSSKPQGRTRNFNQGQELLLFFMRIRGGFLLEDIGYRFNLSPAFISRMVTTSVQILYEKFNSIRTYMFPSREIIKNNLPARFKKFKDIRVIIDCAEIRCEKSSSFEQQGNCYSEYKAHTTFKFLVGCTPNGAVSFVSDLMEGSIHDREIVVRSGLIDLLEEGDLVLADRGFTIRDLTDEKGAILKIPAFLKGRERLTAQEELETKEIAANRIFVEHVVGRIKNNRIFQRVVPLSMRPILSQVVFVCACLLNFHEPLVE